MSTLMQASNQWATRPSDERFTSLTDMAAHFTHQRQHSRALVAPSREIMCEPAITLDAEGKERQNGIVITGRERQAVYAPTHHAFSQVAQLARGPAGYLRSLPAAIAADCVNYGLRFLRDVEDVGLLLYKNGGDGLLRAATGPRYGRIWNNDVVNGLVQTFGDGVTGAWKVPGEFGKAVAVTKANTTLYAGDRDMFVFLADEENRIEVPDRREGRAGSLARGFFMWNSEVGSTTFGLGTFLFDYACCNRIVWGAEDYQEIRIRHTSGAPERWLEEVAPALESYRHAGTTNVTEAIEAARQHRLEEELDEFLATRFGRGAVDKIKAVHMLEEGRPIETRWDVVTGATAWARGIQWQDDRVAVERQAGLLLAA